MRRESQERMEPAKKRRMSSPVWEHCDFIPPNKVCKFLQKMYFHNTDGAIQFMLSGFTFVQGEVFAMCQGAGI